MGQLNVIYCRDPGLGTVAIRAASWWQPWGHCAVIDGDIVIESLALRGGVVISTLKEVIARSTVHEIVQIECPDPEKGLNWARTTVGLPYDWSGIFAIPFRERNWQNPNKWYCSELVEQTIVMSGRIRFRDGLPGITPNQSYYTI